MNAARHGKVTRRFAVALVALVAALAPSLAHADHLPASSPVPIEAVEGATMSYAVNTTHSGPAAVRTMSEKITESGGTVVQTWPEIGVIIAHSTAANFRFALAEAAGDALASVGATRTVAVSEGTPTPAFDESPLHAAWQSANGDIAGEAAPDASPEPRAAEQWDLTAIGADRAAAVTTGSRTVLVGVLDGGIDPDHPDLQSQIDVASSVNCTDAGRIDTGALAWQATTSEHGTHVAGTIAAARNDVGIAGVAAGVRIASVKVVGDAGLIYPEYAVCGFMWAARHGMDVTNSSYFVDPFMYYCPDQGDQAAALQAVRRAVAWSARLGVVNVAAAGNESTDLTTVSTDATSPNDGVPTARAIDDACLNIPGELPDVITVGSIDASGALSSFSNTGMGVIDVVAPGGDVLSTVGSESGWEAMSGTSMASPHVAGVAALIKSTHPDWTAAEVREAVVSQATPRPCPAPSAPDASRGCVEQDGQTNLYGAGVVDAFAAVTE